MGPNGSDRHSGDSTARPQVDPEESLELLLRDLGTARGGLDPREAARRLEQHGAN